MISDIKHPLPPLIKKFPSPPPIYHSDHSKHKQQSLRPISAQYHHRLLLKPSRQQQHAHRPKSALQFRVKVNNICKTALKISSSQNKGNMKTQYLQNIIKQKSNDYDKFERVDKKKRSLIADRKKQTKHFTIKKQNKSASMKRNITLDTIQLKQMHQQLLKKLAVNSKELQSKIKINPYFSNQATGKRQAEVQIYAIKPKEATQMNQEASNVNLMVMSDQKIFQKNILNTQGKMIKEALKIFKDSSNTIQLSNNYMVVSKQVKLKKTCFRPNYHLNQEASKSNKPIPVQTPCKTIKILWSKPNKQSKQNMKQEKQQNYVIKANKDKMLGYSKYFQGISMVCNKNCIGAEDIEQNLTLKELNNLFQQNSNAQS